ncbi:MAG TPA: glucose-1-phosphate thymidylyltransferase RfbA [Candidatus Saccharimonadales bacterium]|nr:glucose-1-phosphate thymidylyltransferase RfbA [Candidatus Saccharimonadales bacterium]
MKGIILAGGLGTRLYPATLPVCKQLLPVYDKPMVYYPLSTLMLASIREILIISTPNDTSRFEQLLGNGQWLGLNTAYEVQENPRGGIAQALIIGEDFVAGEDVALILGDNIFYGHGLPELLLNARNDVETHGAGIFGYRVEDPKSFGIIEFAADGQTVASIVEKPREPKSNWAALGLYLYDGQAATIARGVRPSGRGELEITSVNQAYLERDQLRATKLGRGFCWFDAGTHDDLLAASEFVQTIQKRTGQQIGCVEEIAYLKGWIDRSTLLELAKRFEKSGYGQYLLRLAEEAER